MPSPVEIWELFGQLLVLGPPAAVVELLRWKRASPLMANTAK
jgi:hypothetical protein